jgi:hypothetical protein
MNLLPTILAVGFLFQQYIRRPRAMHQTTIKLNVTDIKRIKTPYDGTNPANTDEYSTTGRTYIAAVRLQDVPIELADWRKINVRDPKMTSGVARAIVGSLQDSPESFFFKNRGLTIIASDIHLRDRGDGAAIELVFTDPETNGLLDGGHTFAAIQGYIESLREESLEKAAAVNGHVKLEIIVGLQNTDDIVAVVEARNTSTQVKEESLQELAHHFDSIKTAINGQLYANRIAYKEVELAEDGSKKDIDVKELLSYIICFDAEKYTFESTEQPVVAYSSKAAIVKYFKEKANRDRLEKYIILLPEILELRDRIYAELPRAYNDAQSGAFGKLTGVSEAKRGQKLPFSGKDAPKQIPSSFIYPLLAAFRALVKVENDKAYWTDNPLAVWDQQKERLATTIVDEAKRLQNPTKMGKQKSLWEQCYQRLMIARLTK